MPWPRTGAIQYHAHLGLPGKCLAIKGLVVCNNWDLEPLDLLNGLALGGYQLSLEVLIVWSHWYVLNYDKRKSSKGSFKLSICESHVFPYSIENYRVFSSLRCMQKKMHI